jgi:hypothetical protein
VNKEAKNISQNGHVQSPVSWIANAAMTGASDGAADEAMP